MVSESFYPFVDNGSSSREQDIDPPAYAARIAVYDAMTVPPRVVTIPPSDVRTYLDEITKSVWELATQQGGEWPFHIIRELVENYIHASFIEPTISILDKGRTISFSDQGPGIPNKEDALRPTFSSATTAMKRYIRGTGSGLPLVEAQVKLQHGSITIEDNLNRGVVVTISLEQGIPQNATSGDLENTPDVSVGVGDYARYMPGRQAAPSYPPQTYALSGPPQSNPVGAPQTYDFVGNQPEYPQGRWQAQVPGASFGDREYAGSMSLYPRQDLYAPSGTSSRSQTPSGPLITAEERTILGLFLNQEKIGTNEVSRVLGISKSTASRRLQGMREEGYITKHGQKYILTSEGRRVLASVISEE